MSQYRCPLFGQGDELDMESPAGGIANSHKELIPVSDDTLGGYYPLAVPRDQMAEYPADFSIPSASKWFWRVKTWTATVHYAPGVGGVDPLDSSFELEAFQGFSPTPFGDDEVLLHDPLAGISAHSRQWRGSVDLGDDNNMSVVLDIGSFNAHDNLDPVPALNELFHELSDGTFAPVIYIVAQVHARTAPDEVLEINGTSYSSDADAFELILDTLPISGAACSDPLHTDSLRVELIPASFWSWGGIWDTATGAALSNPRV